MTATETGSNAPDCCGNWNPEKDECRACLFGGACMTVVLRFEPVLLRTVQTTTRKYEERDPNPFVVPEHRELFDALLQMCGQAKRKPMSIQTVNDDQRAVLRALEKGTTDLEGVDGEVLAIFAGEMAIQAITQSTFELMPTPFRQAHKLAGRKQVTADET